MIKWYKKLGVAIVITTATTFAAPQITYSAPISLHNYIDVPSEWAKEEVDKAKELNLISETILGSYNKNITREELSELAVKLYEAFTGSEVTNQGENPFTDTQNPKVIAANSLGIVFGIGNGEFAPNNTATREAVSVTLYRTLKVAKPEYSYKKPTGYIFSDSNIISTWAQEAIQYLCAAKVIKGMGDNTFNPQDETTREQAIVIVKRMYETFVNGEPVIEDQRPSRGGGNETINKLRALIPNEMGKPYYWGATGPDSFDCSGLVYYLYGKLGITLPRVAAAQATVGTYVAKEDLAYGDLVFFAKDGRNIHHVGIYVGNGQFVHAPQSGDVVRATTLMSGYYARTYYTARRVID